jgi:hypothetical protein
MQTKSDMRRNGANKTAQESYDRLFRAVGVLKQFRFLSRMFEQDIERVFARTAESQPDGFVGALEGGLVGLPADQGIAGGLGFFFPSHEPGIEVLEAQHGAGRGLLNGQKFVHLRFAVFDLAEHADHGVAANLAPVLVDDGAVEFAAIVAADEPQVVELHVSRRLGVLRHAGRGAEEDAAQKQGRKNKCLTRWRLQD